MVFRQLIFKMRSFSFANSRELANGKIEIYMVKSDKFIEVAAAVIEKDGKFLISSARIPPPQACGGGWIAEHEINPALILPCFQ